MTAAATRSPSGVFSLPRWLSGPPRKYITSSGGQWRPEDVAMAFALTLRIYDSADAVRQTARRLVDRVCLEHQPRMKLLAKERDDAKVLDAALKIVNRVCDMYGISPGAVFKLNDPPPDPPRCHMKPMRLAGYHKHRHWKCQHCSHTKPLDWRQE